MKLMNIEENIQRFKHIEKEVRSDLDEILDTINEINHRNRQNISAKAIEENTKILKTYEKLFRDYSLLLAKNEVSLKRAEKAKENL